MLRQLYTGPCHSTIQFLYAGVLLHYNRPPPCGCSVIYVSISRNGSCRSTPQTSNVVTNHTSNVVTNHTSNVVTNHSSNVVTNHSSNVVMQKHTSNITAGLAKIMQKHTQNITAGLARIMQKHTSNITAGLARVMSCRSTLQISQQGWPKSCHAEAHFKYHSRVGQSHVMQKHTSNITAGLAEIMYMCI